MTYQILDCPKIEDMTFKCEFTNTLINQEEKDCNIDC